MNIIQRVPTFAEKVAGGVGQGVSNALSPQYQQMAMQVAEAKKARQSEAMNFANNILTTSGITDPSQKMQADLQLKAQKYLDQGMGLGEMQKKLTEDTINLSNAVHQAQEAPKARTGLTALTEFALGKGLKGDKRLKAAQTQISPLLENGYIDEARKILNKRGYGPVETEKIISKYGEPTKQIVDSMPDLTKKQGTYFKGFKKGFQKEFQGKIPLTEEDQQIFKDNLSQVLTENPNSNLLVLRDQYEKKGIHWDDFLDAILDFKDSGQFTTSPDQEKLMSYLLEPPLDRLDKLMHGIKLMSK